MRHLKAGRKLGRNASHRVALMRNLALALFRRERIITTVEKAKEARRFVEKIITLAKKGTLHARRLALARLGSCAKAEVNPEGETDADHQTILTKLFNEIGPRFKDRPGGYTRVIKRHERRLGDGGRTAFLELLKEGETKVRARQPAPAPRPEEETRAPEEEQETPAPEAGPREQPAQPPQGEAPAPQAAAPEGQPPAPGTQPTPPAENPPRT